MELLPDPTTVHYHFPGGLSDRIHRKFEDFLVELSGFMSVI
jgi:prolycopene isomerase